MKKERARVPPSSSVIPPPSSFHFLPVRFALVTVDPQVRVPQDVAAFPQPPRVSSAGSGAGHRRDVAAGADDAAPVVRAQDLGKRFKLYRNPWHRAAEWLTFGRTTLHTEFWALRGVSFDVRRGECLGIIGPNGSGKSTLLKMLSGAMHPTTGTFAVAGRVLSLLELGTGLNPDLSGRANVIQGAELLGFPPDYGRERLADIEAFAELGEFFDRPVRTYSSGMFVRLAFSMFASFEPDVFVVDEALSVGDVFFQQKCVRRIEQMVAGGTTMLFVSHDMQLVQRLCDRGILLGGGRVAFAGEPDELVSRYYSAVGAARSQGPDRPATATVPVVGAAAVVPVADRAALVAGDVLMAARSRHGDGPLRLVAATLAAAGGPAGLSFVQSDVAEFRVLLTAAAAVERPACGIHLYDRLGNLVFAAGTTQLRVPVPPMRAGDERVLTFRLTLSVQPGEYTLSAGTSEVPPPGPDVGVLHDQAEGIGPIAIHPSDEVPARFYGIARLPLEILT